MELPPCPARRHFEQETDVFFCAHPQHHVQDNLVTAEICRICQLWRQPAPSEFRPFVASAHPKRRDGACSYLGEQVGLRECPTCRGTVRVKVFACHHPRHRETTFSECAQCPD